MLTGDKIVVVAVHAVIVDDGQAALALSCIWPLEDWRNFCGPSRRGTMPRHTGRGICRRRGRPFGHGSWRCCLPPRMTTVSGTWAGEACTMLAQLSPIAGGSSSRHHYRGMESGEQMLCGREDPGSTEIFCIGELSRSVACLSELTPAHVPRREPEPICDGRHCWRHSFWHAVERGSPRRRLGC